MGLSSAIVAALAASASAQQILLQACAPGGGSPSQLFRSGTDTSHHLVHIASGLCVQAISGCCGGEEIRAGDTLELRACGASYQSQMFGLPNATFAALTVLATEGEPEVDTAVGQLVIDGGGALYPGALAQLHTYDAVASPFTVVGTPASAQLRNDASGLCLTAGGSVAAKDPPLALAPCRGGQAPGDYFSSQLFAPAGGVLRTSRGLCATAERAWGTGTEVAGQIRVVGASCAAGGGGAAPAQAISQTPDGEFTAPGVSPADLVLDAGAGAWWGAPVRHRHRGVVLLCARQRGHALTPPPRVPARPPARPPTGRPHADPRLSDGSLRLRALAR